jgi:hypothetical protein
MSLKSLLRRELRRATVGLRDEEVAFDHPLRSIRTRILLLSAVPALLFLGAATSLAFHSAKPATAALIMAGLMFLVGIASLPRVTEPRRSAVAAMYLIAAAAFVSLIVFGGVLMMILAHAAPR